MPDSFRQHFAELRDALERRYHEGLEALDRAEAAIFGESPRPGDPVRAGATSQVSTQRPTDEGSHVEMVYAAIRSQPKTVDELAMELPLAPEQIRAVLYSRKSRQVVGRVRRGKLKAFQMKAESHSPATIVPAQSSNSVASQVDAILQKHPEGLTPSEVKAALNGKVEGENWRNAISSAIYNLKQSKRARFDEKTGRLFAVPQ